MHEEGAFTSRLYRAYVSLMFGVERIDGSRVVPIARYGAFEVRLVEFRRSFDASLFWIELYGHDTQTSLDRRPCGDLDHAEITLQHLISRARALHTAGR